ncbi:hypothetical protein [Rothia sp. CCM 9416]|uniref:hypothetical protein n=1 Tax=Rothia sp. CCM 9416 TaxID=3402655 RepID=UPI003AED5C76
MRSFDVSVPRDIEADMVASLRQAGIKASTIVPAERGAGTVRVSRTGGTDDDYEGQRDTADLLIEVWEEDSISAYATAQRAYAALLALAMRGTTATGQPIYKAEIAPPRAYDDPQAPALYRVTFTATISTTLETITIHLED